MDSAFIHQAANELVQTAGTRNIKQIARSCSLDISETSRILTNDDTSRVDVTIALTQNVIIPS